MAYVRMHEQGAYHFITNRTEHELFLLLPTDSILSIISQWFTKAMALYGGGIELYAVIFMSNHFHLLLRDDGGNLARFMCYMQSNIAKSLNRLLERKGKFWSRHYDDLIIEGEETFLNRFAYICCNSVKAGLTIRADEWLGFNGLKQAKSGEPITVSVFNRTRYAKASRNLKNKPDKKDFYETFSFEMATPPMWQDLSQKEIADKMDQLIQAQDYEFNKKRNFKPVLGMDNVLQQKTTDQPQKVSTSPRVRFMTDSKERTKELHQIYRAFNGSYREIWGQYQKATKRKRRPPIEWPTWSYPPSDWTPMGYEQAA